MRLKSALRRGVAAAVIAGIVVSSGIPAYAARWDIANGDITVKAGDTEGTNKVTQGETIDKDDTNTVITGESDKNTVTIDTSKGDVDVTFDDLKIDVSGKKEGDVSGDSPVDAGKAAVTVQGGGDATIALDGDNKLKRGSLEVTKTSEDGLVEGMTFHLYGTSLSGQPVDEYAVTDGNGVARFENVLIGTGYVLEEVDTPIRYVVPDSQTATIEWNEVTHKSVNNVLKKFRVTVTKSDVETGAPQGDGSLAGAVYGLYKGDTLIDSFTTDENGQITTG